MKYVLFVCTHNAGRSQIAQAFFQRYAPDDVRAESAGEEPAKEIWPNVAEAMREVGIDISHRRPKKLDLEMQLHADWTITLHCKASCPFVPSQVEDWTCALSPRCLLLATLLAGSTRQTARLGQRA
jgi:arsenate reductase (thioredoxin)